MMNPVCTTRLFSASNLPSRCLSPTRWKSSKLGSSYHSTASSTTCMGNKPRVCHLQSKRSIGFVTRKSSSNKGDVGQQSPKQNDENLVWHKVLDLQSVFRTLASLNIDLPKYAPKYKRLESTVNPEQSPEVAGTRKPATSLDMQEPAMPRGDTDRETDISFSPSTQDPAFRRRIHRLHSKVSQRVIDREQHDFEQCINNQYDCIKNYHEYDAQRMSQINNENSSDHIVQVQQNCSASVPNQFKSPQPAKLRPSGIATFGFVSKDEAVIDTEIYKKNPSSAISIDILSKPLNSLKEYLPRGLRPGVNTGGIREQEKTAVVKKVISQSAIDKRTRGLVTGLKKSSTQMSTLVRLEEFCKHLYQYPDARQLAVKEKVIPKLLKIQQSKDLSVKQQAMEALALVGFCGPVKGRGIRILSIDGGGTKGLMAIELLRKLEEACNMEVSAMFDYVCGTSTGALIACMMAAYNVPPDDMEQIYRTCATEMFQSNRLAGAGRLVTSHAYYNSAVWEKILRQNLGETTYMTTTRDAACPKFAAVSTVVNKTAPSSFLFRNYTYPQGMYSHYPGTFKAKMWEGIRASAAAPGYFEEFKHGDRIHQDGGLLTNNPTAIAIHECRQLWPHDAIQCVVSIGTGRYQPILEHTDSATSLKDKLVQVVHSATDTEAVHTTLQDLLPPSTYFRFNTYMSENYELDEVNPDKWKQMYSDTVMYCRKNEYKFQKAAQQLMQTKKLHQKVSDWIKFKVDTMSG